MISIKNHKTATALLATAALAAVLVGGTVTIGSNHFVLADGMNKNDTGRVQVHLTCVISPQPGVYPCTRT